MDIYIDMLVTLIYPNRIDLIGSIVKLSHTYVVELNLLIHHPIM